MTKILMVCMGNICRSPLAEGILKSKLNTTDYYIDSAGTNGNYHENEPPDARAIKVAYENKLDISTQKARLFLPEDFETFDIIYVMDKFNYDSLMKMTDNEAHKAKVKIILDEVFPDEHLEVPDPYYESDFAFRNVYKMLDEACTVIASKLQSH